MYTVQRWIKLLVLLLILVSVNVLAEEGERINDEGGILEDIQEAAEDAFEVIEHVVEEVAEVAHVKEVQQMVEDVVEASGNMQETAVKAAKSFFDNIKTKATCAVDRVVTESKNVVQRCKNMSKADVKKVAAAAVGIWGVAVGVGYITKGSVPPPPPSNTGKVFARKK